MFIATKNSELITIHEVEWQCRCRAKGLSKPEYWIWLKTVTTEGDNGVKSYDFSSEDYEIVETDAPLSFIDKDDNGNDVTISFNQSGHIHSGIDTGQHYHLKYVDGKIVKDDDALKECQDRAMWATVRAQRDLKLKGTDHLALQDQPAMSNDMQVYRKSLRDVPQDQSDPYNITWPAPPAT